MREWELAHLRKEEEEEQKSSQRGRLQIRASQKASNFSEERSEINSGGD